MIQAAGGDLEIGAGVCLGRGVLIVGTGTIEPNACIGAGTTAIDPQIAAGDVIPPYSLLGDRSRGELSVVNPADPTMKTTSVADRIVEPESNPEPEPEPENPWDTPTAWDTPIEHPVEAQPRVTPPSVETPVAETNNQSDQETKTTIEIERVSVKSVSGRANFDRLKRQLFPNG